MKSWLKSQLVDGSATWKILEEVRPDNCDDDIADGKAEKVRNAFTESVSLH